MTKKWTLPSTEGVTFVQRFCFTKDRVHRIAGI